MEDREVEPAVCVEPAVEAAGRAEPAGGDVVRSQREREAHAAATSCFGSGSTAMVLLQGC
jgi:hypothetical protein